MNEQALDEYNYDSTPGSSMLWFGYFVRMKDNTEHENIEQICWRKLQIHAHTTMHQD